MHSKFLQVENTVSFMCIVTEVKSYIQFLFYADFILGLLVVVYECAMQVFDVQNPQVPAIYQTVFEVKSFFVWSVFLMMMLMVTARDNGIRLKKCEDNRSILQVFKRYLDIRL